MVRVAVAKSHSNASSESAHADVRSAPAATRTSGLPFGQTFGLSFGLQRKPIISAPGDEQENEADAVADKVMRMADPSAVTAAPISIQRKCATCDCADCKDESHQSIQREATSTSHTHQGLDAGAALREARAPGQPLPVDVRAFFEPRFGHDFSRVRVHADGAAADAARGVQARAYTVGQDIVFGQGHYAPRTTEGRRLLAHELVHTVQQGGGRFGGAERIARDALTKAQVKKIKNGDVVSQLLIGGGKVLVSMSPSGDVFEYDLTKNTLEPGTYEGLFDSRGPQARAKDKSADSWVPFVVRYVQTTRESPNPQQLTFPKSFTVIVSGGVATNAGANGAAGGANAQPAEAPAKAEDPKQASKAPSDAAKGATVKTTSPPTDAKVPVIRITDPKQIEELKQKGLIPTEDADKIKAKLEKSESLTYDEAIKLVDGLNRIRIQGDKPEEGKQSWLDWAKFVDKNKDKLSGKSKTSADGMTTDDAKAIIDKYNEFVGVPDAPTSPEKKALAERDFNPERRKSWNDLADWEKQIWQEYKKGFPGGDASERTDLHLKDHDLLTMALRLSTAYMPAGAGAAAKELFLNPIFIGSALVAIGSYLGLWTIPEPFSKGVAAGITVALLALFSVAEIKSLAFAWAGITSASAKARSMADLDAAAQPFGKAVGGSGVRILVTLATLYGAKSIPKDGVTRTGPPRLSFAQTAGGPSLPMPVLTEGATITVLIDGTVVISSTSVIGLATGQAMMSTGGTGGGSGGSNKEEPAKQETSPTADPPTPGTTPAPTAPGRLPVPPTPGGIGTNDFGKLMRWGTGNADARAQIPGLTREGLQKGGVTREIAEAWAAFYRNEILRNPKNPSAQGRAELMEAAAKLLP